MKLNIMVDENSVHIIGAASVIDMVTSSMRIVNSLYTSLIESGDESAAMTLREVFYDKDMVDAMFAVTQEDRDSILNNMQKKRLEKVFRMLLEDDD